MSNQTALEQFSGLYKAAWCGLSSRYDDVPHFAEIAASFDRLTQTENGRALIYAFASTRSTPFCTTGDDLVTTRNRAAFMIALAQFKKTLAAQQPTAQNAAKPAAKPAATPDKIQIVLHNDPNSVLEINLRQFFPCAVPQLRRLMKLVNEDATHADAHRAAIVATLHEIAKRDGADKAAATKNLIALGEAEQAARPVKVKGKTELFEMLDHNDGQPVRRLCSGYRAEYAGYTFYFTKTAGGSSGWKVFESRSGLLASPRTFQSKAACAKWFADISSENLRKLDLDTLEQNKLAAPMQAVALVA